MEKNEKRVDSIEKPVEPAAFTWPPESRPWARISKEFKLAFLAACVCGFVAHLYVFTNLIIGLDAVNCAFYTNETEGLTSGRWALPFFSSLSGVEQMPVVVGLISILMLSLAVALTVRFLELTHLVGIVLTAALMVTFPTVACTFSYMYAADAYFITLFLNALAVYLAKKYQYGWVSAIALIALACGVYQAYVCFAAGLLLFDCVLALLDRVKIKEVLVRGGKYILTLVSGLVLYVVIEKILLAVNDAQLNTYQGMDSIGALNLSERLAAIPKAYQLLFKDFVEWPYTTAWFDLFQTGTLLVGLASLLYLLSSRKISKDIPRLLLVVVGLALLPLAINFVVVLAPTANIHRLMVYAYILVFVFLVKFMEMSARQLLRPGRKGLAVAFGVAAILCAGVVWNNFCLSNIGYHSMQLSYENTFAAMNRAAGRIEELDGYTPGTPVAFVGIASGDTYGNQVEYARYATAISNCTWNHTIFTPYLWHYIGIRAPYVNGEQREALNSSEIVAAMPAFPAEGSVAMVDGIAVVKWGEGDVQ